MFFKEFVLAFAIPFVFGGIIKLGTHLGFNAIKMLKAISLALLTQVET